MDRFINSSPQTITVLANNTVHCFAWTTPVIIWDGGNNDFPFYVPDLHITVTDPHRAGHGLNYYPGEVTLRMSDAVIINKIDSGHPDEIALIRNIVRETVPTAPIIEAASPIRVDDPSVIRNKRVLVLEDGPTLTHGGMKIGPLHSNKLLLRIVALCHCRTK